MGQNVCAAVDSDAMKRCPDETGVRADIMLLAYCDERKARTTTNCCKSSSIERQITILNQAIVLVCYSSVVTVSYCMRNRRSGWVSETLTMDAIGHNFLVVWLKMRVVNMQQAYVLDRKRLTVNES